MKELNELSAWTDSILNEFVRPSKNDKPVELKRDIKTLAQHKYPSYDAEDALALYVADKLEDFEKQNAEQNKVINTQGKMLTKKIDALGQAEEELRSVQDYSQQELERIKALSTQKKSDLQTTVASRQEVEQLLQQVEQLRSKPGVSSEQYSELKQQIEAQAKQGIDIEKLQALEKQIADIGDQREVGRDQLTRISSMADELTAQKQELASTERELVQKVADLEKREADHEREINDKVKKGIARADAKRKREARATYNTSKKRLDALEPRVEKEEEINRTQQQAIAALTQQAQANLARRTQSDRTSSQNPYANAGDDDEISQKQQYNTTASIYKDINERSIRKGNQPTLQWDESIERSINDILGPEYAKYLK